MVQQWAGGHPITLPPKSITLTKDIRKALWSRKKLGYNNFPHGILSEKWDKFQQKYEKNENEENSWNVLATSLELCSIEAVYRVLR